VNKKKKLTKKHKQGAEQGRVGGLGRSEQAGDAGQGRVAAEISIGVTAWRLIWQGTMFDWGCLVHI
jgi:hypothetical protein